jgi:predicted O-linked N-acetylglucosamine transferase (SPINDLY family)
LATVVRFRKLTMQQRAIQQSYDQAVQHHKAGRLQEAERLYQQVLAAQPMHFDALHCLGMIAAQTNRGDMAVKLIRQAIALRPDFPEAYFNLGNALKDQAQLDEAIAALQQAITLKPDYAGAYCNLGNALHAKGQLDAALKAYHRAMELEPDSALVHSNLIYGMQYHPDIDAAAILQEARRWNARHAEPLRAQVKPHHNDRSPDRRLRIGYLGGHFRDHCNSFFTLPLLANHDTSHFEVFGYANLETGDAATEQIRGQCEHWRWIGNVSDARAAAMIREDKIDILVDLVMHLGNARPLIVARKPAPVQIAWVAYPGTTGNWAVDYRISDPYLDPPGCDESVYSEQTLRLPDTFWCYRPLNPDVDQGPLPALAKRKITFGCLNNFCKINTRTLELWAPVLAAVGNSELILLSPLGRQRQDVLDFFAGKNIDPNRIRFVEHQPRRKYLELHREIDLGLDTLPYNGHTTSLDALRMGVPVVTRIGNTVVGRAGFSQLSNLGLTELAGRTDEEFASIAVNLANDLPRLMQLRSTLRQRMTASPLMDAPRFARNMEAIYRRVWRQWCGSRG